MSDAGFFDAVENIRERLYTVNQQLRLLSQLTVHETHSPVTIQSETFSVAMNHLADQVRKAAEDVETLQQCREDISPE